MRSDEIRPVLKSVEVAATTDRAFKIFTSDMHRWWPVCKPSAHDQRETIVIEPRTGGRWFERTTKGIEHDWGRVLAWDPPERVLFTWQIGLDQKFDPNLLSEVEVRFEDVGAGRTRVTVEHRNLEQFGLRAEEARAIYDGPGAWIGVLDAFRDAT